ncbi:MAG: T9SS type A sorting domain-containing protein, partial [Bacteroidota bacterium]
VTTVGGSLTTNLEGLHTLLVADDQGCTLLDSFFVDFSSEQEFFVDFLLPERALINDSTVAIDISWPIPDSVIWSFEDPSITDLGIFANQQWLSFAEEGTYEITLEAYSGGCAGSMSREVQIFASRDSIPFYDTLRSGGEIRTVMLAPNPHQGYFDVEVELAQELPVTLLVIDAAGQPVDQRRLPPAQRVIESYALPQLPAGSYTLVVLTANSQVSLRHIKTD